MFPASLQHPYVPRGRRRGRNDPNSRDYICPCGKSYLSYPALFTHIKIKHNGRAPGQIIKPKTESTSKRGRPRQQQYDSQSDTNDIAANCIDRLCDFVTEFEKPDDDQITRKLKDLYMKDAFYKVYVNYNPQEQEPVYNQRDDLYDEYCDNVFCEVIAQVNKRINQPYHIDTVIIFFMLMAHFINESSATQNIEQQRNQPNYGYGEYIQNEDENAQNQEYMQEAQNQQNEQELVQQEYIQPENENDEKGQKQNYGSKSNEKIARHEKSQQMNKNSQYVDDQEQIDGNEDTFEKLKQQPIRNIVNYVNDFILKYTQKYYEVYNLKDSEFFFEDNIKAFIELFFHWLTMKKYIGFKVKINRNYK